MDERKALMQAVLDDPEDDLVRLVFADWLEENGEPDFAEYIRVEIEWAKVEDDEEVDPDRKRAARLAHERVSEGTPYPTEHPPKWNEYLFRKRGWVESVRCTTDQWIARGEGLTANEPVQILELLRCAEREAFTEAMGVPWNSRIRTLSICDQGVIDEELIDGLSLTSLTGLLGLDLEANHLTGASLRAIADTPAFAGLRELALMYNEIDAAGVVALAESPWVRHLRVLNLNLNPIGPEGTEAIASSANFQHLECLDLSGLQRLIPLIGNAGVAFLAASPHLKSLTRLTLNTNKLDDEAAASLASSPNLPALRQLDLSDNRLTTRGIAALLASPFMDGLEELHLSWNGVGERWETGLFEKADAQPTLRYLDFGSNNLTDTLVIDLLRSPRLARLDSLVLSGNLGMGADAIVALCSHEGLRSSLRTLYLNHTRPDLAGCESIAFTSWQRLRHLYLSHCSIDRAGVRFLAEHLNAPTLESLDLSFNPIGDEGAVALANAGGLPGLRTLQLAECRIGNAGAEAILRSELFRRLHHIRLTGNAFSEEWRRKLREAFPDIVIV